MLNSVKLFFGTVCLMNATAVIADVTVPVYFTAVQGVGKMAGTVTISENKYGLLFIPTMQGLSPGIHGFHIHQNASCDDHGMAAGGHFDPKSTGKHLGPYNDKGHLGDLPALYVDAEGKATTPVLASRLMKIEDIKNHALMIHEGGDNYSDVPQKLGGGGNRMECGIIK